MLEAGFAEEAVDRTFSGKKFGDFIVRTGRPEGGYIGAYILYKSIFVDFIVDNAELEPFKAEDLDHWVELVLNKIKIGMGEK